MRKEALQILEKAFGEDGAHKRANVEKLRGKVRASWAEDGPSSLALQGLLDALHA